MKSNEDNKTWISHILVRNIFLMFKTSLLLLNFCLCVYFQFSDIFFLLRKFKTVPIVIKAFKLNLHFGSASLIRRYKLQVALLYFRTNNLDPLGSLYRCCLVLWVLVSMSKVQCSCSCVVLLEVISLDESSFTFQIWKVEPVLWEFGKNVNAQNPPYAQFILALDLRQLGSEKFAKCTL